MGTFRSHQSGTVYDRLTGAIVCHFSVTKVRWISDEQIAEYRFHHLVPFSFRECRIGQTRKSIRIDANAPYWMTQNGAVGYEEMRRFFTYIDDVLFKATYFSRDDSENELEMLIPIVAKMIGNPRYFPVQQPPDFQLLKVKYLRSIFRSRHFLRLPLDMLLYIVSLMIAFTLTRRLVHHCIQSCT